MSFLRPSPPVALLLAAFAGLTPALRAEPEPATTAGRAKAQAARAAARAALERVKREVGGRAPEALEREILRDPWTAKGYLEYLGYPRIAGLERALLADPGVAAAYAAEVLCSRWPEAEPVIASDPFAAATYSRSVLCRPWPEAEPVIFSNGNATAWYHDCFPDRITPEARKRMESDPWGATLCAETGGARRPGLEPVILKNPEAAAHYAAFVLRARWPEAEPVIANDPAAAAFYAEKVVNGRWIQGESAIARSREALRVYLDIPGVAWPEGAMRLADALAETGDRECFSIALLNDPAAWERLAKRPGLRARLRAWAGDRQDPNAPLPMPPAGDFALDAEAAVFFAGKTRKRFPEGEPEVLKSPMMSVRYAESVLRGRWPEAEPGIARHGEAAARYAGFVMKSRWPEAEPAILTRPVDAANYAAWVLRKPWPEGEAVIATTADGAFRYAAEVLKARWLPGEPVVARSEKAADYAVRLLSERWSDAEFAVARDSRGCAGYAEKFKLTDWPEACEILTLNDPSELGGLLEKLAPRKRPESGKLILATRAAPAVSAYAKHVLAGRWPEGEALLLQKRDAGLALNYAEEVIRGRWPEAEPFILRSPFAAEYADRVAKSRLPDAEPGILKSPHAASHYAVTVLKARWPAAEPVILSDPQATGHYVRELVKGRWPEAEPTLARTVSSDLVHYCVNNADTRVPVMERAILSGDSPEVAVEYAQRVVRGRWPEAEPLILREPGHAVRYASEVLRGRWPEAEPVVLKDPDAAAYYATTVLNARWPEAEPAILRSASAGSGYIKAFLKERTPSVERAILDSGNGSHALAYARSVIGGAWPEGEPVIAGGAYSSFEYAKFIGRRFPAGEPAILSDGRFADDYAREVLRARWPEAEPLIMRDPWPAVRYAREVIKGRLIEAEPVIATGAWASVEYARDVLRGRFVAGEPVILQEAGCAAEYAANVLKTRWPEAEPVIIRDRQAAKKYAIGVLKRRWPEAEPVIFSDTGNLHDYDRAFPEAVAARANFDPSVALDLALKKGARDEAAERVIIRAPWAALRYAGEVLKDRWPEAEPAIAGEPWAAVCYAREVIKGRWPEAEPGILKSPYHASEYAETVIRGRWPDAEAAVATKPLSALHYARCVLKARWPAGEEAIRREAGTALVYAAEVLRARWPEAEPVIAGDARRALGYATLVINGRWPEAEPGIFRNGFGPLYAIRVLRKRSPDIEAELFSGGSAFKVPYLRAFVTERDPAVEKLLLAAAKKPGDGGWGAADALVTYAECARRERWPEAEPYILQDERARSGYLIAMFAGRRWPEYEAASVAAGDSVPPGDHPESVASANRPKAPAGPPDEKDGAKLSRDEARILFQDTSRAFRHARDVIKGRWPEFEEFLMKKRVSSPAFTGGTEYGAAFHDSYRDEWGRVMRDRDGNPDRVASRYIREIVRGPLPEYEPEFARVTESAVCYAAATRREFPAGEPRILESMNGFSARYRQATRYILGLLDDPGAKADFARLFKGPDGARWCRAALNEVSLFDFKYSDDPGASELRARLESRE